MTKDEAMKMAQAVCPYFDEISKGAFYEGFITALDQLPDTTKMIDTGTDRGAWSDVPDATKWVDELRGDDVEEPPNSTTDVVEPVAWVGEAESGYRDIDWDKEALQRVYPFVYPLYTAPPKREWVGLTDGEALALVAYTHPLMSKLSVARAIEAKLKEKNHGNAKG